MNYIRENHPDFFAIADAKRADIGATNEAYAVLSSMNWVSMPSRCIPTWVAKP
jgi:orotidine-5'-phosphate decarboxylase